jgi:hypothetical protein
MRLLTIQQTISSRCQRGDGAGRRRFKRPGDQRPFTRRMKAVAGELRQSGSVPDLKPRTEPDWRAGSPFSAQAFASAGA